MPYLLFDALAAAWKTTVVALSALAAAEWLAPYWDAHIFWQAVLEALQQS